MKLDELVDSKNLKALSLDMAIETKLAGNSKHLIEIANEIYEYLKSDDI